MFRWRSWVDLDAAGGAGAAVTGGATVSPRTAPQRAQRVVLASFSAPQSATSQRQVDPVSLVSRHCGLCIGFSSRKCLSLDTDANAGYPIPPTWLTISAAT